MKAIDFVVRDGAGGLQRGVVSADGNAHIIQAGSGQEISLNLRQSDLQGQVRSGNDLIITLNDGRMITIDNYFNSGGQANRLFISSDGYLNEVSFVDQGAGDLYAQFGPTEQWGKWSPSDDLIYLGRTETASVVAPGGDNEVSMLGVPLLGALGGGLGTAAAVAGGAVAVAGVAGGGGGGGGGVEEPAGPAAPHVDQPEANSDIGGDDNTVDSLTVTGGGEPGDTVVVRIGDKEVETVIGPDGTYSAVFEGSNFPADGVYESVVTVTTSGGVVVLDGPSFHIDTTAPEIEVTGGTESVGDSFNADGFASGVTLTGKGEAGSTLDVTISGVTQSTTVGEDGMWSVSWANGTLESGEYTTDVTFVSTDSFGNSSTSTDTVIIDTVSNVTIETSTVAGDGTVNFVESQGGVTLTGTTQPGSSVVVTFGSGTHNATVDANGNWTVDFPMGEVPTGELTATVTAVATDSFGNSSTSTGQVDIDTLVRDFGFTGTTGGADGVINIAEATGGFTMTGTTEPGSSVSVTMNGFTHQATVAANGTWTVNFAQGEIPTGEQTVVMSATATDAAGNVETITQDVVVDRDAGILTISSNPIEGDNVINAAEASDGVTLMGTTNANATVVVTMNGVSHTVMADGAGNWSSNFASYEVAPGTYTADIHASTVDPAGNPLEATSSVQVDTEVENLSINVGAVGGADSVINGMERLANGGMQISGTTEVGSTSVVVNFNGVDVNANVDAGGNWTAVYSAGQISEGTYNAPVMVTATDRAGNVDTANGTVRVDTEVVPFAMNSGAGGADGVANAAEVATGIDLGGQVEAGSSVMVTFDGTQHTANVDSAGNWSLTIPPSAIRAGTYSANISVTATDMAGNMDTITDTLAIDTDAPEGPVIASFTRDGDGIRGITTEINDDDLAVHEVASNGAVSEVGGIQSDDNVFNETRFGFNNDVPDGSHLVITATDDAGNINGTYVVFDDEAAATQVTLNANTLGDFNIETLDLKFAEEGNLTIDETTLLALSGNSNELQINGGQDDTVNIAGASKTGSTMRDGDRYDIYTLGDEGTLVINDQIDVNT